MPISNTCLVRYVRITFYALNGVIPLYGVHSPHMYIHLQAMGHEHELLTLLTRKGLLLNTASLCVGMTQRILTTV